MATSERDFKVILTLTEEEARQVHIHLHPKYFPNKCDAIRKAISDALGYVPVDHEDD